MTKTLSIYPSCGTPAGYRRHLRDDTSTCPRCKKAIATYMRQYRYNAGLVQGRIVPVGVASAYIPKEKLR